MLKTIGLFVTSVWADDNKVVNGNAKNSDIGNVSGLYILKKSLTKSKNQNLKSRNLVKSGNNKATKEFKFLTSKTRKKFIHITVIKYLWLKVVR